MTSPYAPVPPPNRPPRPTPFGTGVMPARVQVSGAGRGSSLARQALAQAPPVPGRESSLETLLPVESQDGGGYFGEGFLEGAWDALNYKILPEWVESGPGPLGTVGGVVRDFSSVFDLGLTAGAAAAAPFTGGGSLIARAAIGGGVKGLGAKGIKFALAPAVEGGFAKRLAAESAIGLGAIGAGKAGSAIGQEIGGTPGAVIGGLAAGFAGGGAGLLVARRAFGIPRVAMGPMTRAPESATVIDSIYRPGETLPGGSQRQSVDPWKPSHKVGSFDGHYTDREMADRGYDTKQLTDETVEAEPDHGPLSSALRYLKNMAVGMGGDYSPNHQYGRMIGLFNIFKAREDQAGGLVHTAVAPLARNFKRLFEDGQGNVLTIPSLQGELLTPNPHVQLNLRAVDPDNYTLGEIDYARLGLEAKEPEMPRQGQAGGYKAFDGPHDGPAETRNFIKVDLQFDKTRPTRSEEVYDSATGLPTGESADWYTPPGQIPETTPNDLGISDVFRNAGRDIVAVVMPDGTRQGFYKRTGRGGPSGEAGSGAAGQWVPFDGITSLQGSPWFNKARFTSGAGADPTNPLFRTGEEVYADIGKVLDESALPQGKDVSETAVNRLIGSAESAQSQKDLEISLGGRPRPGMAQQVREADEQAKAWRADQPLPSQAQPGDVTGRLPGAEDVDEALRQVDEFGKTRDALRRILIKLDTGKRLTKAEKAIVDKFNLESPTARMGSTGNRFAMGSEESRRAALGRIEQELDQQVRGAQASALEIEDRGIKALAAAGRRLQDEHIRKIAGGDAATKTTVNSSTMSQVFEDLFHDANLTEAAGAVKFGPGLFLREMPDGRFINPRRGFVVSREQAEFVAQVHAMIDDANRWLTGVAGVEVPKMLLGLEAGQRYTPRIVISRIVGMAQSKSQSTGARPSRPMDIDESFENARKYKDDAVNEALRDGVVYENDMVAVVATYLTAVYRAGRNEQLKNSLIAGGFEQSTRSVFDTAKLLLQELEEATSPPKMSLKAGERPPPIRTDLTEREVEKLLGLRGEEGRAIAEQVFTLFKNAKETQESTRRSFVNVGADSSNTPEGEVLRQRKKISKPAYGFTSESLQDAAGKLPGTDILETPAVRDALRKEASELQTRLKSFEGTLLQVGDPLFQGNFYDERTANAIRKFTGADQGGWQQNMEYASQVADAGRTMQASGDLSGAFIQGLLLLAVDPASWGKGAVNMARALVDPNVLSDFLVQRRGQISQYRDLQIAPPTEYFRGLGQQGILGKGLRGLDKVTGLDRTPIKPGAAVLSGLNRFERAFTYFGTYARVELMGAFETLARNPEEFRQAQDIVNKMTGVTSHGAQILGPKQEHFERTFLFFAPRYTRASMGAVWALVNPKGGIESSIARDAVTKLAVGGTISYVMFAEALQQEPKLDPTKGDFMTLEINGDRIGVGTVWRSMARLATPLATDPAFQGKLGDSPLLFQSSAPGPTSIDQRLMDNPLIRWARGRTSVMTGTAWEIATGADFMGEAIEGPVDIAKHLGSNALPFALESALMGSPRRTHSGIIAPNQVSWTDPLSYVPTGIGSEFMGLRNAPVSFSQERKEKRNLVAIEEHGVPWDDLNRLQQNRLEDGNAELTELSAKARQSRVIRGEEIDRAVDGWFAEQDRIDREYDLQIGIGLEAAQLQQISLRDFRQNHLAAANQARRIKKAEVDNPEANPQYKDVRDWFEYIANDLPGRNPEKPEDIAYSKYLDTILLNPDLNQPTGFNFREKRRLEHEFEREVGTDTYNYVRARLADGKDLHPLVQELLGGQEEFKWFWGSADEPGSINWQIIQNRNNPEVETALFVRWEESTDREKEILEAESPALRSIIKQRSQVRSKVRQFDARLDVFLYRWGYTSSLKHPNHQFSDARDLAILPQAMETYMLTGSTLDSQQISELGAA